MRDVKSMSYDKTGITGMLPMCLDKFLNIVKGGVTGVRPETPRIINYDDMAQIFCIENVLQFFIDRSIFLSFCRDPC